MNECLVFERILQKVEPKYDNYTFKSQTLNRFLQKEGIKLYSHQAQAFRLLLDEDKNVVITTPTASGKSLIYILTILEKISLNPDSRAILLFPLIALANDQYEKIYSLIKRSSIKATVSVYTGNTDGEDRRSIRNNPPNILITTPDMLSIGILPNHRLWSDFFNGLDTVVIDELHSYRGVLGSHVANVIRRLKRVVSFYNNQKIQFILNSATIKNPVKFAQKFIDEDVVELSTSGAGSPIKFLRVYKNLPKHQITEIVVEFLKKDISTIVFLDSRKEVELFHTRLRKYLEEKHLEKYINLITPYRSGYTNKERREIEKKLSKGEYKVVVSTSALEMGIDIGSIDACVLIGFPGTLSAMWQRFGRAGRRDKRAYNIFIPKKDILDQYFLNNPEELLNKEVEEPVINPQNPYILKKHFIAMANEKPIDLSEIKNSEEKYILRELILEGELLFKNSKVYPKKKINFSLRSASEQFDIIEEKNMKTIGYLNGEFVMYEAHKNAIYIHNGRYYLVSDVDFKNRKIFVIPTKPYYFTDPLKDTQIEIVNIEKSKKIKDVELFYGDINVRTSVIGYSKRDIDSSERIEDIFFQKDMYERNFKTKSMWFVLSENYEDKIKSNILSEKVKDFISFLRNLKIDDYTLNQIKDLASDRSFSIQRFKNLLDDNTFFVKNLLMSRDKIKGKDLEDFRGSLNRIQDTFVGSLHGVEHSMIGIFSIIAMNDRWDIGGMSTNFHYQTGKPTIFIYDGYEGGIGYSEVGFERFDELVEITYKNVSNCNCLNGCPSCILSPKCGNANEFLDKAGTKILLKLLKENFIS
ncbi:MAG: DEAD/DEAH box helicase [Hydrogenothermaceae bacterium]|nr:DEAD/DEAH box helicase [Hydrogenothermaceae bacterium]